MPGIWLFGRPAVHVVHSIHRGRHSCHFAIVMYDWQTCFGIPNLSWRTWSSLIFPHGRSVLNFETFLSRSCHALLASCIAYIYAFFSIWSASELLMLTLQGVTTNKVRCEHGRFQVGSSLQTGMRVHWITLIATHQKAISIR